MQRYDRYFRLSMVVVIGAIASLLCTAAFDPSLAPIAMLVGAVMWCGIASILGDRGSGSYLIAGAISPWIGCAVMGALGAAISGYGTFFSVRDGFVLGIIVTRDHALVFVPIGMMVGVLVRFVMRAHDSRVEV